MRYYTRTLSILIIAFISVFLILLLPLSASPAFAEDNPPPDPTPIAESAPPTVNPPGEDPVIQETPEEPIVESTEAEANVETTVEPSEVVEPEVTDALASAPESSDTVPDSVDVDVEASIQTFDPDPFFTIGPTTYRFSSGATYCDEQLSWGSLLHPGFG
jgi:hypothetical protein